MANPTASNVLIAIDEDMIKDLPAVIREASWLSDSVRDLQARDRGFDPQLPLGCIMLGRCAPIGKVLRPHVHSLDPGVSGYPVGQCRLVSLNSSVRRKWQPGCVLPGELRWIMNERGPVTRG